MRSLEDQANAMVQGYTSTNEWAIAEIIKRVQTLQMRMDALESHLGYPAEVVDHDPDDYVAG